MNDFGRKRSTEILTSVCDFEFSFFFIFLSRKLYSKLLFFAVNPFAKELDLTSHGKLINTVIKKFDYFDFFLIFQSTKLYSKLLFSAVNPFAEQLDKI